MKWIKEQPIPIPFLVLAVVVLSAAYLIFFSPKLKSLRSLQNELESIEAEILKAEALVKSDELPGEKEKKKWAAAKAKIDAIPARIKLAELMGELAKLARRHQIPEVSFSNVRSTPSFEPAEPGIHLGDFSIRLSFNCQYRNLANFLKGLDLMNMGAVVESLEANKAPPSIHTELNVRPIWVAK